MSTSHPGYDLSLGRFNQADSIVPGAGDPRAWDRYSYVKNNPILYNDPSGHCELVCVIAIIGAGLILSQIPSDTPQADLANQGNPYVMLGGLSLMGPVGDLIATSIDCLISGCDPNTAFPSAFVPGPSPSMVEHAASYTDEAEALVTKTGDLTGGVTSLGILDPAEDLWNSSQTGSRQNIRVNPNLNSLEWFNDNVNSSTISPHPNPSLAQEGGLTGIYKYNQDVSIYYRTNSKSGGSVLEFNGHPNLPYHAKIHEMQ